MAFAMRCDTSRGNGWSWRSNREQDGGTRWETRLLQWRFFRKGMYDWTRLRERTVDKVIDLLPVDYPAIPGVSAAEVVAALVTLERRGVVRRARERVHSYDSAEYLVTWCHAGATRDTTLSAPRRCIVAESKDSNAPFSHPLQSCSQSSLMLHATSVCLILAAKEKE